jgi:hypothetical protein
MAMGVRTVGVVIEVPSIAHMLHVHTVAVPPLVEGRGEERGGEQRGIPGRHVHV